MKFRNFKAHWLLLFGILLLASCEYESIVFSEPDPEDPVEDVSFSQELIPIFKDNCTVCHSVGHFKVDLTEENAYTDLFAKGMIDINTPENSRLYKALAVSGGVHYEKLNPIQNQLILNWIIQGAKDN